MGVLIETALFRVFPRTGIYLFNEGTPSWVYQVYRTGVWIGNTMSNFATITVALLFALMVAYLWGRRITGGKILPVMAAGMLVWHVALFFFVPGPALAVLYLVLSAAIVVTSLAVVWNRSAKAERATLLLLAASYMGVYYFETISPLRQAGWTFADYGIQVFQVGEALAGAGILAAFLAWGRTRNLKIMALPVFAGILLAGSYLGDPDRFPLISTWALGVTMSLPFVFYAAGVVLLGITFLKLVSSGRHMLAFGLILVLFSHRMLPLTYFNMLVLGGFLLMAITFWTRPPQVNGLSEIPE